MPGLRHRRTLRRAVAGTRPGRPENRARRSAIGSGPPRSSVTDGGSLFESQGKRLDEAPTAFGELAMMVSHAHLPFGLPGNPESRYHPGRFGVHREILAKG
jgi:hypothetical protein